MVERSCVNVSGLSSGASFAPGHDGYQRALALLSGKARFGRLGHQISNAPAGVVPSLGSVSQTSVGSSFVGSSVNRVSSGADAPGLVVPRAGEHTPGDARQLVGERDGKDIAVHAP